MKTITISIGIMGGLLLAGSDGPLFPWVNLFGVVVLSLSLLSTGAMRR